MKAVVQGEGFVVVVVEGDFERARRLRKVRSLELELELELVQPSLCLWGGLEGRLVKMGSGSWYGSVISLSTVGDSWGGLGGPSVLIFRL